jgi:hypothetical protein
LKLERFDMPVPSSIGLKGWAIVSLALTVLGCAAAANSSSAGIAPQAVAAIDAAAPPLVDRAHKGDRLGGPSDTKRKIFEKRPALRLVEACEPVGSPYVDPGLAEIPGRCFA